VIRLNITAIKEILDKCYKAYLSNGLKVYSLGKFSSLSGTEQQLLFNKLYFLTQCGFSQPSSYELEQDTWGHVSNAEFLYLVVEDQDNIISYSLFNIYQWQRKSILYLSGSMVDPKFQGKGISSNVLKFVAARFQTDYIAARTQNPVMYSSFHKACDKAYPSFHTNDKIPQIIKAIGFYLAKDILKMKFYLPDKMVGIETYGHCLYGKEPLHSSKTIDEVFKKNVNLKRGDSVLLIGTISKGW